MHVIFLPVYQTYLTFALRSDAIADGRSCSVYGKGVVQATLQIILDKVPYLYLIFR